MTATTTSPTLVRIVLTSSNMNTAQLEKVLDLVPGSPLGSNSTHHQQTLSAFIDGGSSRTYPQNLLLNVGATSATGTLTVTSTGPVNGETFVVAGVTFTAETSGATGNQFNISSSPTTVAKNIATAVNASASTAGLVTATSALGVVTFTSAVPGSIGNFLTLTESLTNAAVSGAGTLTNGAEGDTFTINQL